MTYRKLRARLKAAYTGAKGFVIRRFRSYGPRELEVALRALGVAERDTLLVHAAFTPFSGFRGSPQDLLERLRLILGRDGNLLMMSMAYTTSAYEYLKREEPFDVRRTMSRMGLLTEVFRRGSGVHRSLNPIHPVLASGPLAAWLIAEHETTPFSCGEDTPLERLVRLGGKILLFDVSYITATFLHHLEHRFRDRLSAKVYHDELLEATVVAADGTVRRLKTHVFEPATARARDRIWLDLEVEFGRRGAFRKSRVGNTGLILIDTRRLIDCAAELLPAARVNGGAG